MPKAQAIKEILNCTSSKWKMFCYKGDHQGNEKEAESVPKRPNSAEPVHADGKGSHKITQVKWFWALCSEEAKAKVLDFRPNKVRDPSVTGCHYCPFPSLIHLLPLWPLVSLIFPELTKDIATSSLGIHPPLCPELSPQPAWLSAPVVTTLDRCHLRAHPFRWPPVLHPAPPSQHFPFTLLYSSSSPSSLTY